MIDENSNEQKADETIPVLDQQTETNKEVRKIQRKKNPAGKTKSNKSPVSFNKIESNPPRPDVQFIEKGDLLVPVE